jgi:hypothetical protein
MFRLHCVIFRNNFALLALLIKVGLRFSINETFLINTLKTKSNIIILKDSFRTAQWTHSASILKINQLMLCREIMAVYSEIYAKVIINCVGRMYKFWTLYLEIHEITTGL